MATPLLVTVVALVALGASPARAERDPDLGIDQVAPTGVPEQTTRGSEAPADTATPRTSQRAPNAPPGTVARATFTTAVIEREPQDSIVALSNDHDLVFYFTELQGFEGQTLIHRWTYRGDVVAEVPFRVAGPRWRVYSRKNLEPVWLGDWSVSVVDEAGNTLTSNAFEYVKASPPEAATREAPSDTSEPSEPPPGSPLRSMD
jgi:hypothetical protein